MVVHACIPSTLETKVEDGKFESSLGNLASLSQMETKKESGMLLSLEGLGSNPSPLLQKKRKKPQEGMSSRLQRKSSHQTLL